MQFGNWTILLTPGTFFCCVWLLRFTPESCYEGKNSDKIREHWYNPPSMESTVITINLFPLNTGEIKWWETVNALCFFHPACSPQVGMSRASASSLLAAFTLRWWMHNADFICCCLPKCLSTFSFPDAAATAQQLVELCWKLDQAAGLG